MRTAVNPQTGETVYLDEATKQWLPMEKGQQPQESMGRGLARSALQGMSLEFGDELTGLLGAIPATLTGQAPFGEAYRDIRDMEREAQTRFDEQNPALGIAGRIGGGVLTGMGAGNLMRGGRLATEMASAPLKERALAAGLSGAIGGGVTGAGANVEPENLASDFQSGELIGAAIGPISEFAISALQKAKNAGARLLSPETGARRRLTRAIEDSGLEPKDVPRRLEALGEESVLADVGEGTRAELEWLAQRPGATQQRVAEQLTGRSRRQAGEIMKPFGAGRQLEMLDNLKEVRRVEASPLYEQAFARGVPHTRELESIFRGLQKSDPGFWREARRQGIRDAIANGEEVTEEMFGTATRPSLRGWQAVKELLDDKFGTFQRSGANKSAGSIQGIQRRLLQELDRLNPDYAKAREQWAGTKRFEEMMEAGRKFLREPSSETISNLRSLPAVDKEAYRIGVAQAIEDRIERMGDTHDIAKLFRNEGMRRKLSAIWGDDDKLKEFIELVDASTEKQKTFAMAAPGSGSRTARTQAREADQTVSDILQFTSDLATGTPGGASAGLLRTMIRRAPTTRASTRDMVGRALLEANPEEQRRIIQGLLSPPQVPRTTGGGLLAPALFGAGGGLISTQ